MSPGSDKSRSSSGSNSSSTGEEERLKRLFNSCDGDGDGYLDREDFRFMCKQLNMEELAEEIMQQLGLKEQSRITFSDFIRYKTQVLAEELDQSLGIEDQGIDSDTSGVNKQQNNMTSWPTMSSDSFGALSGRPDSLDYDSGARDMSPEPVSLHQLMDSHDPDVLRQACDDSVTSDMLELANRTLQLNPPWILYRSAIIGRYWLQASRQQLYSHFVEFYHSCNSQYAQMHLQLMTSPEHRLLRNPQLQLRALPSNIAKHL
ncbi:hypothetical protein FSP39_018096 [Pinctada imbricata]|uniref:EF-hand domain-containing protein n=1 Tax=Pinctada imbricata TaxID=66713 RepID=A0AA89BZL6_PINIB|nr:hypothetical protein FSP39_018096 [Pinctada imbricata]